MHGREVSQWDEVTYLTCGRLFGFKTLEYDPVFRKQWPFIFIPKLSVKTAHALLIEGVKLHFTSRDKKDISNLPFQPNKS